MKTMQNAEYTVQNIVEFALCDFHFTCSTILIESNLAKDL